MISTSGCSGYRTGDGSAARIAREGHGIGPRPPSGYRTPDPDSAREDADTEREFRGMTLNMGTKPIQQAGYPLAETAGGDRVGLAPNVQGRHTREDSLLRNSHPGDEFLGGTGFCDMLGFRYRGRQDGV